MAEGGKKPDEAFLSNLAHLKRRALDVKFDLDAAEYMPQENIGIGAYGVVCSAVHSKTRDRVAIKKIPNVFDVLDVAKRTYREIKILKHFKHDNIIHIREMLKPKESLAEFRDVYVVFDLMESDLHRIIYSKQDLSEEHVRYFLYQLLRGLKYVHSANVIHRDLKPSNLLVNEDCQLRIGDFGMARGVSSSPEEPNYFMTQYVATRWYRAPEIMLSLVEYGTAVDMWSVGCIFAEMLIRKHLFPGKDYISQIKLIVGILGSPNDDLLQLCHSPIIRSLLKKMGHKDAIPWTKLFPKASRKASNLLSRLLVLNPKDRLSVEQALVHPFLNKYHDPDDEPICVPGFNFEFEKENFNMQQLREMIHEEAMGYHKPRTPTFSFNAFLRPVPKSADTPQPQSQIAKTPQGTSLLPPDVKRAVTSAHSTSASTYNSHCSRESSQQIPLINTHDSDLTKRPLSAKNESSEVKIDTDLLKVDSADVEMLSAKADGKQQLVPDIKQEQKPKENREPAKENKNNTTISEDTKNMIKAALLNASLKKRKDSQGDEEKLKPVTAAMRQKEREDKRKKKKEKGLERRKKNKLKKASQSDALLSDADKELLYRWAKMQKVNVPIAPKPAVDVKVDAHLTGKSENIGVTTVGPTIAASTNAGSVISEAVYETVQSANPDPVKFDPVAVPTRNTVEVKGHGQSAVPSGTYKQTNILEGTRALLQQHLRTQGSSSQSGEQEKRNTNDPNVISQRSTENISSRVDSQSYQAFPSCSQSANTNTVTSSPDGFSVDFSNVNLGDLDFLSLVSSPEIMSQVTTSANIGGLGTDTNYSCTPHTCAPDLIPKFSISEAEKHPVDLHNPVGFHNYQTLPFPQMNTGRFHTQPQQQAAQIQSDALQSLQTQNQLSPSQLFQQSFQEYQQPNQTSPTRIFSTSPAGSQHSVSPQFNHSPEDPARISPNLRIPPNTQVSQSLQDGYTHVQHLPYQTNRDPIFSNIANPIHPNDGNVFHYHNATGATNIPDLRLGAKSTSPPSLLINTHQTQMSFQQMFQHPVPGTSASTSLDTQNSLISLLTKQLSKSNVDDLCPPLALTPRGTGGGYGVGVDLDNLMMVSHDHEGHPAEPSPSSSILADWMEVTGNMNIDLDALEQELSSPMALSYNDFNMYSS